MRNNRKDEEQVCNDSVCREDTLVYDLRDAIREFMKATSSGWHSLVLKKPHVQARKVLKGRESDGEEEARH